MQTYPAKLTGKDRRNWNETHALSIDIALKDAKLPDATRLTYFLCGSI
ncbi:MAG: hypothetical protein H7062_10355 [Candidatus Saccharimonas sp.]|nr:hypothetical protein [Planctomycetaceae bacterium]